MDELWCFLSLIVVVVYFIEKLRHHFLQVFFIQLINVLNFITVEYVCLNLIVIMEYVIGYHFCLSCQKLKGVYT